MNGVRLHVRVRPGARLTRIITWADNVLQVSVNAPAREGLANQAVIALVAEALHLPKSSVGLVRGARGRDKLLAIEGVQEAELRHRLAAFATTESG